MRVRSIMIKSPILAVIFAVISYLAATKGNEIEEGFLMYWFVILSMGTLVGAAVMVFTFIIAWMDVE